jgi:transmembrane sensor
MDTRKPRVNPIVLEEATAWFVDMNEAAPGHARRAEFNEWLYRSPEHVRAYLQVSTFYEDASLLRSGDLDSDSLLALARSESNVHQLDPARLDPHPVQRPSSSRWRIASAAILLLLGAAIWYGVFRAPAYDTEIGEQRSITLEDGSIVELNARSRLVVRFSKPVRRVELLEGQALFRVAHNSARPFIVSSGETEVRAVGTQFDVYRKATATVVTVIEGQVAVNEPGTRLHASGSASISPAPQAPGKGEVLLRAGEQLTVSPHEPSFAKEANVAAATAWTRKILVFHDTPLREVVEEFNRYNRRQLVIRDTALYDFHVSGEFPSTDSSRMVEFLRQRFGIATGRDGDSLEISRRPPATTTSDP